MHVCSMTPCGHHASAYRHEFSERQSISLYKATALSFSASGHSFAVATGSTIFIYRTGAHEPLGRLKGHMSAVTALQWAADDRTLLSASAGGAVYFWDACTCLRIREREYVDKACNFQTLQVSVDGSGGAARCTDGPVHFVGHATLTHTVAAPSGFALPIAFAGEGHLLLGGTATGELSCWPWPQQLPAAAAHQQATSTAAHAAALKHIAVAGGGTLLVTAGDDGVIMTWSLQVRSVTHPAPEPTVPH